MEKQSKVNSKSERFNAYCNRIIDSAASDIYRERYKQMKPVIPLEEIFVQEGYQTQEECEKYLS